MLNKLYVPKDYPTIQKALNTANEGDTVFVSNGTYFENIQWPEKNGIKLIGENREKTIIDGRSKSSVITIKPTIIDSSTIISGFTIKNGKTKGEKRAKVYKDQWGGHIDESEEALANLTKGRIGGGICCENASPLLINLIITNNNAGWGGGIYLKKSNSIIKNVIIKNNSTWSSGAGIFCEVSSPHVTDLIIYGNTAESLGGGICCRRSSPKIYNTIIYNNESSMGGGILSFENSSPVITNVVITDNKIIGMGNGGGIYNEDSNPTFINCVVWNNGLEEICSISIINIFYSNIQGGYQGEGNIDADPLFLKPTIGDFTLQANSPCKNKGIAKFEFNSKEIINLNKEQYKGENPDMGILEFII